MISKKKIRTSFKSNKKVAENYFFMTLIRFLNSFFTFLIYPYLIRVLGVNNFGLYIFALSIASYVSVFVGFGFNNPNVREVVLYKDDKDKLSDVLSSVLTAQFYFFVVSMLILILIVFLVPFLRKDYCLFLVCAVSAISTFLFPIWFFQGMEQMRIVTYIQLFTRLLSLPLIFLFVKSVDDYTVLAVINSGSVILGALIALFLILFRYKIPIKRKPVLDIVPYIKDAFPFFWGDSASVIKMQSTSFFTGTFISMSSVALYDLANKFVMFLSMLLANINNALFPKMVKKKSKNAVKKALLSQLILGLLCVVFLAVLGQFLISLLGGKDMLGAYPILLILSIVIPCWLLVGAIQLFIIIPLKRYKYITVSQILAFVIYMFLTIIGAVIYKNIYWIAAAMSLSAIVELVYNSIVVKNLDMLSKLED